MKVLAVFLLFLVTYCVCEQARRQTNDERVKSKVQPKDNLLNPHRDANDNVLPNSRNKLIPKVEPITNLKKTAKIVKVPIIPAVRKIINKPLTTHLPTNTNGKLIISRNSQIPIKGHESKVNSKLRDRLLTEEDIGNQSQKLEKETNNDLNSTVSELKHGPPTKPLVKTSSIPKSKKQNLMPNPVSNTEERKSYIISKLSNIKIKPEDKILSEVKKKANIASENEADVSNNVAKQALTPVESLLNDKKKTLSAGVNNNVSDYNSTHPELNRTKSSKSDEVFKLLINPLIGNFVYDMSNLEKTNTDKENIDDLIIKPNYIETKNTINESAKELKPEFHVNNKNDEDLNNCGMVQPENLQPNSSFMLINKPRTRVAENDLTAVTPFRNNIDGYSINNSPSVIYYRPYIMQDTPNNVQNQYKPDTYNEPTYEFCTEVTNKQIYKINGVSDEQSGNKRDADNMSWKIRSNTEVVIEKAKNEQTDTEMQVKYKIAEKPILFTNNNHQKQTPLLNNYYNGNPTYNYNNQRRYLPWYDYIRYQEQNLPKSTCFCAPIQRIIS